MLRDVFYYGAKPNAHPRERFAKNLDDARSMATTEHFWIINEFCDYTNFEWDFDFDFLSDEEVWTENHINVWPSVYQKDSSTWLVANNDSELIIYRNDVARLKRKNIKTDKWKFIDKVDESKFDFGWHPDPTDPPYIYRWGNKYYPVELMAALEYHVDGATEIKYMKAVAELLPEWENWNIPEYIDKNSFDFSWRPDPREPELIYDFGTTLHKAGGPRYVVEGATEVKYVEGKEAKILSRHDDPNWHIVDGITLEHFDYAWYPDPSDPPYIYVFGNQWHKPEIMPTMEYIVPGATEKKYVHNFWGSLAPDTSNWEIPENLDVKEFNFSWVPNPYDPPYIYEFGTQWQKTGGPRYIVPGATEIKYVDSQKAISVSYVRNNWVVPDYVDITTFDFSWHPDNTEKPYIYQFGTQWGKESGPKYVVEGATAQKYVDTQTAKAIVNMTRWRIPDGIDRDNFDFSWAPDTEDQPYIYQFGTQHQKTGGPRYYAIGANDDAIIKYVDTIKAKKLPDQNRFTNIPGIAIEDFDYSWHPDDTDPPYIYKFGNNHYDAETMPTLEYKVEGATDVKYINDVKAALGPNKDAWVIPENIDDTGFDYSWIPHPGDKPYIYMSGTQHQKTGGPKYIVEGATEVKFLEQKVKRLENKKLFEIVDDIPIADFDYSWHPDETEPEYIYVFGNNFYDAVTMPTVRYKVGDAIEIKYIDTIKAKLAPNKNRWFIPEKIDDTGFDYSWVPNPNNPPYIYVSGTQWQKTGGPRYIIEGATEIKYIDKQVRKLEDKTNFQVVGDLIIDSFDYSWHPDDTEPEYIYTFGNQYYNAETMPSVIYKTENATETKYIKYPTATLGQDKRNWIIPRHLDLSEFDFSWKPNPHELPYIYRFGTQHQKTGGPTYATEDATDAKYITVAGSIARALPNQKDPRWKIPENLDVSDFDFSWHPDTTERPYIYQFGTQWQKTGGPKFVMPGAKEVKYISATKAKILPNGDNWEIPDGIDIDSFDFSWHPDETAAPAIYQFGTQHQKTGGPRYISPGVDPESKITYENSQRAYKLPSKKNWTIPDNIDISTIDFTWHPDDTEPAYIYEFGTIWHDRGGPTYTVPGATFKKYTSPFRAKTLPDKSNFKPLLPIDEAQFDYSWIPHPDDPPYIYVFGNQWNSPELEPSMEYTVLGATQIKYMDYPVAKVLSEKDKWTILHDIQEDEFDFSWRPNPKDPPYNYVFGNQYYDAEIMPTLEYKVEGALYNKYINNIKAKIKPKADRWQELIPIDKEKFDFSWVPDPGAPPYIYVFGNQWNKAEIEPTLTYTVPGATEVKYIYDKIAYVLADMTKWHTPDNIDKNSFDYTWRPDPHSPPYIYEFSTKWNNRGGPIYTVPGASQYKYVENIQAKTKSSKKNWIIPLGINVDDFDFSWVPHPEAPPYIYQFGTLMDISDGPRYVVPDNTGEVIRLQRVFKDFDYEEIPEEDGVVDNGNSQRNYNVKTYVIKTNLDDLVKEHPNEVFWATRENIDYSKFDFEWRPDIEQAEYVHVFGSPDSEMTQTYFVVASMYLRGLTDFNFVEKNKASTEYLAQLFKPNDMFFVDKGNPESVERFKKLKERFPELQKTRFLNSWVDTINRCINRSNTVLCWILNSELDYNNFNFDFYPDQWQKHMVHVIGTQWSHWGNTYLVNKQTFPEDTKYVKIIEHLKNINFVKDKKAIATNNLYDIVLIDHGNNCEDVKNLLISKSSGKNVTVVKYEKNYLNTIKNIIKELVLKKEYYIWVCSSVCDYMHFDFSYTVDPFSKDNLHVFPSNNQKFGDTFFIDVNMMNDWIDNLDKLQEYPKVNYNQSVKAHRLPAPVYTIDADTHAGNLVDFDYPYAVFQTEDINIIDQEPMSLWDDESKNIIVTSTGASRIIVPREAKDVVKNELYDYPYIKTASKLGKSKPLDIVFLSNGELCADENYEHLLAVTKGLGNRVVRVDGVDGRVQGYHAALEASETPWAFTVFAKLKVNNKFDWGWQPDRLQIPKHYIFSAKNPVNGLTYGHQAMIAYNKKLTLANTGKGLDFTLDDPHESVDLLSGIATFNTDPYSTWRTAFREVIKLKSDYSEIAEERLNTWLSVAEGDFAENCLQGANDAVEFYDNVMGDIEELKKSYEWAWLKDYYRSKYK